MAGYLTADTIKTLREGRRLTQRALAEAVGVTDKAVSKWESGRGLPDISLVEPLAAALGVSVAELLTGDVRQNANRAGRKDHYISFIAYVTTDGVTIKKLYPEQEAAARFRRGQSGIIVAYCNRHGLVSVRTPRRVARA